MGKIFALAKTKPLLLALLDVLFKKMLGIRLLLWIYFCFNSVLKLVLRFLTLFLDFLRTNFGSCCCCFQYGVGPVLSRKISTETRKDF
jgi:hypothetical protein